MKQKKLTTGKELIMYREKVADIMDAYVKMHGHNEVKHKSEIRLMLEELDCWHVMFLESDICYNKTNKANLKTYPTDVHIFEAMEDKGYFKILGRNYPYNGDLIWKKKNGEEEIVGKWADGKLDYWGDEEANNK